MSVTSCLFQGLAETKPKCRCQTQNPSSPETYLCVDFTSSVESLYPQLCYGSSLHAVTNSYPASCTVLLWHINYHYPQNIFSMQLNNTTYLHYVWWKTCASQKVAWGQWTEPPPMTPSSSPSKVAQEYYQVLKMQFGEVLYLLPFGGFI